MTDGTSMKNNRRNVLVECHCPSITRHIADGSARFSCQRHPRPGNHRCEPQKNRHTPDERSTAGFHGCWWRTWMSSLGSPQLRDTAWHIRSAGQLNVTSRQDLVSCVLMQRPDDLAFHVLAFPPN